MAGLRVTIPRREELHPEHPCNFKPIYHAMFVEPVADALRAVGVEVEPAGRLERGVMLRFAFADRRHVNVLVDYADQVHVDGLVEFALNGGEPIDLLLKMKPCDRYGAEYAAWEAKHGCRVLPFGYVVAPTVNGEPDDCIDNRRWFHDNLADLRKVQDAAIREDRGGLMTRGSYHAMHHCPERRRFYDERLYQGEKTERPFVEHVLELAASRCMLNLCGPDNTIDRKVVEALAIGIPIVSNDGLKDLRLPWGRRFAHGENVLFVENVEQALAWRSMDQATRRTLCHAGRELYEAVFAPRSLGHWMLKCAMEHAL